MYQMNDKLIMEIAKQYCEERLREAEEYRLARQICKRPMDYHYYIFRLLACLGRQLVVWGNKLQERFATHAGPRPLTAQSQPR